MSDLTLIRGAGAMIGPSNMRWWLDLVAKYGAESVEAVVDLLHEQTGQPVNAAKAEEQLKRDAADHDEDDDAPAPQVPAATPASAPAPRPYGLPTTPSRPVSTAPASTPTTVKACSPPSVVGRPLIPSPLYPADRVTMVIEEITPARATSLLALSKGNRVHRAQHIDWLADQMRSGQWRLTHQAVAISAGGRLLDGHHRLTAVKRSGATVQMVVMRGLPDESWENIDCGVVRAVHDRIALDDKSLRNRRVIEVIQQLRRIEVNHKGRMTVDQVTADWQELRAGLTAVFGVLDRSIKGITRAPVMGVLARYWSRAPDHALAFARQLDPRTVVAPDSVAAILRPWLLEGISTSLVGGRLGNVLYWTTATACRAHHFGHPFAPTDMTTDAWW